MYKNPINTIINPKISTIIYMMLYYYMGLTVYILSGIPNLGWINWSLVTIFCTMIIILTPYLYITLSKKYNYIPNKPIMIILFGCLFFILITK